MSAEEFEAFFKTVNIPDKMTFGQGVKIDDVPQFINSHLTIIRHHGENKGSYPFIERLLKLKEMLSNTD